MMLGKKIAIVFTICSLFTFSFSEVTLEIKNVTDTALEVYMTNTAGCYYCTDPSFDNKNGCESYGSGGDATWVFDTTIDAATCSGTCAAAAGGSVSFAEEECTEKGVCSDATYSSVGEESCEANGLCSLPVYKDEASCLAAENDDGVSLDGTWTVKNPATWASHIWTHSAKNGKYFNGEVAGFQFQIKGATTTGISGGTAAQHLSDIIAGGNINIGYSQTGGVIPASSTSVLLATFTYVDDTADTSKGICFGEDIGSSGDNTISDRYSGYIGGDIVAIWGDCICDTDAPIDACGECGGDNTGAGSACYETGSSTTCTADNQCESDSCDCSGTCGGSASTDNCDVCDDNPANDCSQDCNQEWGGTALVDCTNECVALASASPDEDNDGHCDDVDACPGTPANTIVNATGCSMDQDQGLSISQLGSSIPGTFAIEQNFPNPFNPITSITFDVAYMDNISLVIYDLTGKEIVTLASGSYAPGSYNVEWNAIDKNGDAIVSGMYIYRYTTNEKAITRKMLYLK